MFFVFWRLDELWDEIGLPHLRMLVTTKDLCKSHALFWGVVAGLTINHAGRFKVPVGRKTRSFPAAA